jgi:hypothetical protein
MLSRDARDLQILDSPGSSPSPGPVPQMQGVNIQEPESISAGVEVMHGSGLCAIVLYSCEVR